MNNQEYTFNDIYSNPDCLDLTVRKEHRLMVIKKVGTTTFRMSWKTLLYFAFLTFVNILV